MRGTHRNYPPSRYHVCHSGRDEENELISLAFPNKVPPNLSQLLGYEQAGEALEDDEKGAGKGEDGTPPRCQAK